MADTKSMQRFQFIAHALNGDGPFRPSITYDGYNKAAGAGASYLIAYPRESTLKFARRCEVAFYASPLARICSRFTGYVTSREVSRDLGHEMLVKIADDVDGKGNSLDIFWQGFMVDAKARGSMLLLIDAPSVIPENRQDQVDQRLLPFWTQINPEIVTDYQVGEDGKFDFVKFAGQLKNDKGEMEQVTYYFDRSMWKILDKEDKVIREAGHPLGECPVLIFTEKGDFPAFGPFSPIADLSKRLYNLDSELDEILRAQTFSLLCLQVPAGTSAKEKSEAAKTAGETIGAQNMLLFEGSMPGYTAPPDGPATVYMQRIDDIRSQIHEIGLDVADTNQAESGKAKQLRFQALNGELSKFSQGLEDLERRAWYLTTKWLGMEAQPAIAWPRDFNVADVMTELEILREMRDNGMPEDVIKAQQERIITIQFAGTDTEQLDILQNSLDNDRSAL